MDSQYFLRMFEYDFWANQRSLASLKEADAAPEKALHIFDHILGAALVWQSRLQGNRSDHLKIWPDYRSEERESRIEEVYQNWQSYLQSLPPARLVENVSYYNSKGTAFETAVGDILSHVIVHGGYHRGQIATLLRNSGATPAVTDFIAFVRGK